ncbi:uncharacterized protein VTP21DRAFT_2194 [Calcarisporiella thermophila]|uniref:uncharacterized protein n=1 Tax=Calcarisporiella thermophila TaxID=911321 RepID=UPI0037425059
MADIHIARPRPTATTIPEVEDEYIEQDEEVIFEGIEEMELVDGDYMDEELDDDDTSSDDFVDDEDYLSSPSIPDEDIDFDHVYALHDFIATVDGQASVERNDLLSLLDDTNTYWWLVKVLRTSEVGYIPAENVETPHERLARLNKHKNVEFLERLVEELRAIAQEELPQKSKTKGVSFRRPIVACESEESDEDDEDEPEDTMTEETVPKSSSESHSVHSGKMMDEPDDGEEVEQKRATRIDLAKPYILVSELNIPEPLIAEFITDPLPQVDELAAASAEINGVAPSTNGAESEESDVLPQSADAPAPFQLPDEIANRPLPPTPRKSESGSIRKELPAKEKKEGMFLRLFSRGFRKKMLQHPPPFFSMASIRRRNNGSGQHEDGHSYRSHSSSGSLDSYKASVDSLPSSAMSGSGDVTTSLSVLRIFAGNVQLGALFKTVLVNPQTTAEELVKQALSRFHVEQVESSTVEYYLSAQGPNGESFNLAPTDLPLAIFQSLTTHLSNDKSLTTHLRRIPQQDGVVEVKRLGVSTKRRSELNGDDNVVKFLLNKKFKPQVGTMIMRVSLFPEDMPGAPVNGERKKKTQSGERIDKMMAVGGEATVAEATAQALEKFHILQTTGEPLAYRLTMLVGGASSEIALNPADHLWALTQDPAAAVKRNGDAASLHSTGSGGSTAGLRGDATDVRFVLRRVRQY